MDLVLPVLSKGFRD